jgi:cytochrome c oxidase cbb3-type subunit IV
MLKFIKGHMTSIGGIEIYPVISFLIFFTFFAGVAWWVMRQDKDLINEISNLPLEDNSGQIKSSKKTE